MAEELFKIPLTNVPQLFTIELGGRALMMSCVWNAEMPAWEVSLTDGTTLETLTASVALVAGADLLAPFAHLGIPGHLYCYVDGDADADPTFETLGSSANLYYVTD